MPWEEPLYAPIFGSMIPALYKSLPEISFVPEPRSAPESVANIRDLPLAPEGIFKWRVQSQKSVDDYQTVSKTKRLVALGKWRRILECAKDELNLAWMFMGDAPLEDSLVLGSLEDVFGSKATSTIGKRAGSMLQYLSWANMRNIKPFPILEKDAYACVKVLNATAAPSTAMSFREALNFCKHVVGMDSMKDALDSKRVHGACLKHLTGKTQPRQASPFNL